MSPADVVKRYGLSSTDLLPMAFALALVFLSILVLVGFNLTAPQASVNPPIPW